MRRASCRVLAPVLLAVLTVCGGTLAPATAAAPVPGPVAAAPDRIPNPWLLELVPQGVPADVTPYLVRSRRPLAPGPDLTILGQRGGLAVVSGSPDVLLGIARDGAQVAPLPLTVVATPPPAPAIAAPTWNPRIQQLVDAIDWDTVFGHLSYVSRFGDRTCNMKMGTTLALWLTDMGFEQVEKTRVDCYASYYSWNVEAVQPGTISPDTSVVLCAHHDAFDPGADDNASGVATLLQLAELLREHEFRYTIRYVFFTGEESLMVGSNQWVAAAQAAGMPILAALNCDMLGWWTDGVPRDLELETATDWLMSLITTAADLYTDAPYNVHEQNTPWGDHSAFWSRGYAAIDHEEAFDYVDPDMNPHYHTELDKPEYIHRGFMMDNVRVVMAGLCVVADLVDDNVPVRLARFDARRRDGAVRLEWSLAEGLAGGPFRVYRRAAGEGRRLVDGTPWREEGAYVMVDPDPAPTATAYELEERARDGAWVGLGEARAPALPDGGGLLALRASGPNPFNPVAELSLSLPRAGRARLVVHDLRGGVVRVLLDAPLPAGEHEVTWDGRDDAGRAVPSGTYVARLLSGRGQSTCKLTLAR